MFCGALFIFNPLFSASYVLHVFSDSFFFNAPQFAFYSFSYSFEDKATQGKLAVTSLVWYCLMCFNILPWWQLKIHYYVLLEQSNLQGKMWVELLLKIQPHKEHNIQYCHTEVCCL